MTTTVNGTNTCPLRPAQSRNALATLALLAAGAWLVLGGAPAFAGGDWNDAQIQWQDYDKGLSAAKEKKKPVCLVFYTEWCPHCSNFSKVFHDSKVVEQSKNFVMIRMNKDKNQEISKKYAPDGEYIPRTYFLSARGELDPGIHAPRAQFKYFYDEAAPASILAGMDEALKKLKTEPITSRPPEEPQKKGESKP